MAFLLEVFCLHDFVVLTRHGLRNCWCDCLHLDCCSQIIKDVLFAAGSSKSYLSFIYVCARLSWICVAIMAMSSTSMLLFFAVLLAFVMKHVAGMRGPTQTASMLETEVTAWGKDPCEEFGAKRDEDDEDECWCPKELPVPRNCLGRSGRTFGLEYLKATMEEGSSDCRCEEDPCEKFGGKTDKLDSNSCGCPEDRPRATKECGGSPYGFHRSEASDGCRCLTETEALELFKLPVAASALRFCEALVEHGYGATWNNMNNSYRGLSMTDVMHLAFRKTSPEICQHALTGTINKTEAEEAPWAENASELSRHGRDEDGDQDRAYGRMRPVKENATDPAEKALWEHALSQVCKDECTDLLDVMKKETWYLQDDVRDHQVPFAQTCAERVVQHVEAEILGCCGRSCGFDGRRCLLWPFFSPQEKVEWEVECCAEISILKNSSREFMCNSVLPDRLAKKASNFDLEEQSGTDVGKVLIGQNTSLKELKNQRLAKKQKPMEERR